MKITNRKTEAQIAAKKGKAKGGRSVAEDSEEGLETRSAHHTGIYIPVPVTTQLKFTNRKTEAQIAAKKGKAKGSRSVAEDDEGLETRSAHHTGTYIPVPVTIQLKFTNSKTEAQIAAKKGKAKGGRSVAEDDEGLETRSAHHTGLSLF